MVGASPSFSERHVMRTLFLLKDSSLGRKKLVSSLDIGEGSVRTILNRLKKEKLVKSSKRGHSLTEKGHRKISRQLKKFSQPREIHSEIVEGKKVAVVAHDGAKKIDKGWKERDVAVKAGAEGAIIIKYQDKLESTTPDFKLSRFSDLLSQIKNFNLKNGDVIVISFADNLAKAENGALAVALHLTEN